MEEIPISKFKATCLAVLERVRLGALGENMSIVDDIVGPIGDISDWEAAQDGPWDPPPPKTGEE
jgi:hypothetical protein